MEYVNLLWKSFVDFFKHDGPMLAGSITCFLMMSLAPFFLLLVAIFGYFLGEYPEFYDFLSTTIADFFPTVTAGVMDEIQKIITYRKIDIFTLGIYAYFSYQLYFSFERAVNMIFESAKKRSLLKSLILSLLFTFSLIVLLFMFFGVKLFLSFLVAQEQIFPGESFGRFTSLFIGVILPFILVCVITSVAYKIVPQKQITLTNAFTGGLITAVFFEIGKHIFTYYMIMQASKFGVVYGSLTAVVIFLLWVFYAACIFLIGAEITRNLEKSSHAAT